MINLEDARARGIGLPANDEVAQRLIDEQEAWLARRIGPLEGPRTETFYVGSLIGSWGTQRETHGKLGLARYTDAVTVVDGATTLDAALIQLVDKGSAIRLTEPSLSWYWTGPYVAVTYTPNDEAEVRKGLYDLVALAAPPPSPYESETIGAYSYSRGGHATPAATRAAIVASLLPKRAQALTLYAVSRYLGPGDPVINAPEPWT